MQETSSDLEIDAREVAARRRSIAPSLVSPSQTKPAGTDRLFWAGVTLALVLILPVVLVFVVAWSLIGLVFRMPLSYIVIGGWLCVIILFAVNVTHSLPGSTVGLMTAQIVVLALWTVLAFKLVHAYRLWQLACLIVSDGVILCFMAGYATHLDEALVRAFFIACLGTSTYVGIRLLRLWTMTSYNQMEKAEMDLLKDHCRRKVLQKIVAGLGTLIVLDDGDVAEDPISDDTLSQRLLPLHVLGARREFSPQSIRRAHSKPKLVLVHGYAAANAYWMFNLDGLAQHFEVYAVELYGCGRSDRLPWTARRTDEAFEVLRSSIERWRQAMGIDSMLILGHSMGCIAVSAYAIAYPSHVSHLILTSPAGVGSVEVIRPRNAFFRFAGYMWDSNFTPMDVFRWGGAVLGYAICSLVVMTRVKRSPPGSKFHGSVNFKHFLEFAYQNYCATASGERALSPLLGPGAYGRKPMIDWLTSKNGGIQCPVALIYGDPQYDWMQMSHGKQLMEKLHEEGVHCECTFVPGTGHILFIDDPDGFNAAIIDACSRARLKENTKI